MQADSLPAEPQEKPKNSGVGSLPLLQKNNITLYSEPSSLALGLIPFGPLVTQCPPWLSGSGNMPGLFLPSGLLHWQLSVSGMLFSGLCVAGFLLFSSQCRHHRSERTSQTIQHLPQCSISIHHTATLWMLTCYSPPSSYYEKCDLEHSDSTSPV